MIVLFRLRHDTEAAFADENPILGDGEIGYETDTRKSKAGNGSTRWNDLAYDWQPVGETLGRFVDVAPSGNTLLALNPDAQGTLVPVGGFFGQLAAANTAADVRNLLGLGTMAQQDASGVNITGGTITGTNLNE